MVSKKNLGVMKAFAVFCMLALVGCDNPSSNPTAVLDPQAVVLSKPSAVSMTLATDGTFISTGGLITSGTYEMDIAPAGFGHWGTTLHCITVLTDANGTITMRLDCRMVLTSETTAGGPGNWRILRGTGAYKNLHGEGKLTMDIDFVAETAVETLEGKVFYDNRK